MRSIALACLLLTASCGTPPKAPGTDKSQWPVVYRQSFGTPQSVGDFEFTDAPRWKWHHEGDEHGMTLLGNSNYKPPHRSPTSIALIKDLEVEDFELHVDLKQTGRNYGHRDMCLFFGFQSQERFYYTHLATSPDANAHNIFRVSHAARANIAPVAKNGIDWGDNVWHHVRVERRVKEGVIRVYWDNSKEPILVAKDNTFDWGRIGFGSFDDSGIVTNIVVRAPRTRRATGQHNPFGG